MKFWEKILISAFDQVNCSQKVYYVISPFLAYCAGDKQKKEKSSFEEGNYSAKLVQKKNATVYH